MSNRFDSVPADTATTIIGQEVTTVGGYEALRQVWFWEGIFGESLIFVAEDVTALSEGDLTKVVKGEAFVSAESEVTTRANEGFVFANFNFVEAN